MREGDPVRHADPTRDAEGFDQGSGREAAPGTARQRAAGSKGQGAEEPHSYDPGSIEPEWQTRWRENRIFESERDPERPKFYCYNPAPYVTGSLHMGHVRNYVCGDFLAKYMRLRGAAVLYTIGFDAYGLPTEMASIRNARDPDRWTSDCLDAMKRQLIELGCGFDWRRSFVTSEPEYYRWTQWIFLRLFEQGLIYSAVGSTSWCPQCETSLARTQVEDGRCWICASPVERRTISEWRLRLRSYMQDLLDGLADMRDLNGLAEQGQRDLIGSHHEVGDFSISRQRLWGTPIPIVLCDTCGAVPVPDEELPVLAPRVVFDAASGKLQREDADWGRRNCPTCGREARLDPQVMDCHMDSIWHPFRPCAGGDRGFLFDPDEMRYWMPADIIQFGRDVIPFMIDLRFFSHFLHRLGHTPFREFCREVLAHGLILSDGRKMSKHLGNVVTPEDVIRRFGADSLRFYVLSRFEPRSDGRWSEEGVRRHHEILARHYRWVAATAADSQADDSAEAVDLSANDSAEAAVSGDRTAHGMRRGEAAARSPDADHLGRYTRIFLKKAAREIAVLDSTVENGRYDRYASALARLLEAMDFFQAHHLANERHPPFAHTWRTLVRHSVLYLAPVAPHLAEACWNLLGNDQSIFATGRLPEHQAAVLAPPGDAGTTTQETS